MPHIKTKQSAYKPSDFTFVICAYKESPYLEECIRSLKQQRMPVTIIMVTSTPNAHIEAMVKKYGLEYHINRGKGGIAEDWNFGYRMAGSRIVTLAHQDDVYKPEFAEEVLRKVNEHESPLIAFTDYGEIRNGKHVLKNRLLNIKRIMLFPLRCKKFQEIRFIRRRILSIGSPICCPSVTLVKENLPKVIFTPGYRSNIDWQAWERLSRRKGAFVYCTDILMFHRIHENSETTAIIQDNDRAKEDYEMFCKFWPKWVAGIIEHFYRKGEDSNEI